MKKKRIKIIIFISLPLAFFTFLLFTILYNECLKPYEGYDISFIENKNKNMDDEINKFYLDYIDYDSLKNRYIINFYHRDGRKMFYQYFNNRFNHNTNESYSLIIKLENEYDTIKNDFLNKYKFIETKISKRFSTKINELELNSWTFKELYYNVNMNSNNYLIKYYENNMRTKSYWLSYNDTKQEIVFSAMFHNEMNIEYYGVTDLKQYIVKNLYT